MTVEPPYIVAGPTVKRSGPGVDKATPPPGIVKITYAYPGEEFTATDQDGNPFLDTLEDYPGQIVFMPDANERSGKLYVGYSGQWRYVEPYAPLVSSITGKPYDPMQDILNP